jgi:hypothetical protein
MWASMAIDAAVLEAGYTGPTVWRRRLQADRRQSATIPTTRHRVTMPMPPADSVP